MTARLRRDHAEIVDGKVENKYISAYGDRRHLYLPPDYDLLLNDVHVPLLFVEAEKSVLAIIEWGRRAGRKILPIGCGGCWGWRGVVGIKTNSNGEREEEKDALPEVAFAKKGRACGILFDSNCATNPKVKRACEALRSKLTDQGARVMVFGLPALEGVNGPDDFIAIAGDEALRVLLDGKYKSPAANPPLADEIPGRAPITDISNAERLVARFQEEIRYSSDRKAWCVWNEKYWVVGDAMGLARRMQEIARRIYFEAAEETDEGLRQALAKWARRSESGSVQASSIAEARCRVEVLKFAKLFDTHPHLLNFTNGTRDLRAESAGHTGEKTI